MDILKILIWPIFALILVTLFHKQIGSVISRMTHVKYKGLEIELALERVEAKLFDVDQTRTLASPNLPAKPTIERLRSIAAVSPRAAVLEAWLLIETAAAESGFIQGADIPRINTLLFVDWLEHQGRLPLGSVALVRELRDFRDRADASQSVTTPGIVLTTAEAERYISVAAAAAEIILDPSTGEPAGDGTQSKPSAR